MAYGPSGLLGTLTPSASGTLAARVARLGYARQAARQNVHENNGLKKLTQAIVPGSRRTSRTDASPPTSIAGVLTKTNIRNPAWVGVAGSNRLPAPPLSSYPERRLPQQRIVSRATVLIRRRAYTRLPCLWLGPELLVGLISSDNPDCELPGKRTDYAEARAPEYCIADLHDETITGSTMSSMAYAPAHARPRRHFSSASRGRRRLGVQCTDIGLVARPRSL